MDSDFFTEGYAEKKKIQEIDERLVILRDELGHGHDYSRGRSDKEIEEEIAILEKQKQELHLKIEHEETKND